MSITSKYPEVVSSDNVVCYDVDDTLIIWDKYNPNPNFLQYEYDTNCGYVKHHQHIMDLKASKHRGHFVIVWSQGGYAWAHSIVRELGLLPYVDLVMCKPKWMCDDVMPNDWTKVFYKPFKE